MRIGFNQLQHPLLIILEINIAVVNVLVNMTFQLVYKLLFIKTVS